MNKRGYITDSSISVKVLNQENIKVFRKCELKCSDLHSKNILPYHKYHVKYYGLLSVYPFTLLSAYCISGAISICI